MAAHDRIVWRDPSACPDQCKSFDVIDLIAIIHGHFDHLADVVALARQYESGVIGIYEMCHWLERRGVDKLTEMNKGGTVEMAGVQVTMVHADHSCGILDDDGSIVYGGEAVGYVLRFSDGTVVYHAGNTNIFGDMALIRDLYEPDIAMIPIGDRYTMGPKEAAKAVELLQPKMVIPMHFGTFPALTGRPEELADKLAEKGLAHIEICALQPGGRYRTGLSHVTVPRWCRHYSQGFAKDMRTSEKMICVRGYQRARWRKYHQCGARTRLLCSWHLARSFRHSQKRGSTRHF